MIANSHKVFLSTATAVMCAMSFSSSILAQTETAQALAPALETPRQLTLPPGFSAAAQSNKPVEGSASTTSVVPNAQSCPAPNLAAILTPSGAQKTIPDPSRVTGAALGTGSGCPSTPPDVKGPTISQAGRAIGPAIGP